MYHLRSEVCAGEMAVKPQRRRAEKPSMVAIEYLNMAGDLSLAACSCDKPGPNIGNIIDFIGEKLVKKPKRK